MKKIIGFLTVSSLVACGSSVKSVPTTGVSNSADAAKLSGSTLSAMQSVDASASRDFSESATVKCDTSGSVKITADVSTDSASAGTGSVTFAASDCIKTDAYEIDGSATYTFSESSSDANNESISFSLDGKVAVIIYNDDGSIAQSGDVTYNDVKVTLTVTTTTTATGSCVNVTATGTGSITVGGTTYTPTGDEWAGAGLGATNGSFGSCDR